MFVEWRVAGQGTGHRHEEFDLIQFLITFKISR